MVISCSSISECNWYDLAGLTSVLENRLQSYRHWHCACLHIHTCTVDPWDIQLLSLCSDLLFPKHPWWQNYVSLWKIFPQVPQFSVINEKKKSKKMLKVLRKVQSLHLVSTISTCATLHVCESDPGNLWTGCNRPPICWETLQEWLQLPKIIMSLTSSSSYAWGRSHTCASLLASGKQARKKATPTVPSRNHPAPEQGAVVHSKGAGNIEEDSYSQKSER